MKYELYEGFTDPDKDRSVLKDVRGAEKTESLFIEVIQPEVKKKYTPLYSLRNYNNKDYVSAYQIYMASTDETEAALKLVGTLKHWRKLCALNWFMKGRTEAGFEGLLQWREDMAARDINLAKKAVLDQVADGNVTAAKTLIEIAKGNKPTVKGKRKTPVKSEDDVVVEDFLQKQKERNND